jgi:hypothetical protein
MDHVSLARVIDLAMLSHAKSPVLELALENPQIEPSPISTFVAAAILAKYQISIPVGPALREAIVEIAKQKTSDELSAEEHRWADYVHAYDACVVRARAAIKDKP